MTEISEAAQRKALALAMFEAEQNGEPTASAYRRALARVLQEHSDVAKVADCAMAAIGCLENFHAREKLQSLILPDEPCRHEIVWPGSGSVVGRVGSCRLCGSKFKIVEAGDA